ncbi:MAG: Ig-like domain-containing protein, partial [Planctomycetota bacterium]
MSTLRSCRSHLALVFLAASGLAACGGSSGGVVVDDTIGTLEQRPDGALFFVDPNQRGVGSDFRLVEAFWARIVDVYDADGAGVRGSLPLMRRAPVRPDLASDGAAYRLEADALGREALVILHPAGTSGFEDALAAAVQDLPRLAVKHQGSPPPFTSVARNAALVLRFDDLLAAGPDERRELAENVRLAVGYPPAARLLPRVFFDETHGDTLGPDFHPTRVVLDLTVSAVELDADTGALPLNVVGLPASISSSNQANVELRIPTQEDFGSSQFSVLRNLRGRTLDPVESLLHDPGSPTLDVVRAVRSGNETELHNGFLRDDTPPSLVAQWPLAITLAVADPEPGTFQLDLEFPGTCAKALRVGELLALDGVFLEVDGDTAPPDGEGRILAVRVRALTGSSVADELVGAARLFAQFDPALTLDSSCWIEVDGEVGAGLGVAPDAVLGVRFNEPVDPRALDPLETLRLYRDAPDADSTVVAVVAPVDGTSYELTPLASLAHTNGVAETYQLEIRPGTQGVTDLAGNALSAAPAPIELELAASAATADTGGITLRFASADEYDPAGGKDDLRGQFSYDTTRGALRPRPVVRQGFAADGTAGPSALMLALPVSIREPLVPLGSRFQTLWRYADFRWAVEDESLFDLDVEGIGFASFGGLVSTDFLPRFELRLGHSAVLPDEAVDPTTSALLFPDSGLQFLSTPFDANVLEPDGARVVHPRELGFRIRSADQFVTASGTRVLPLPLERGGRAEPFVWRDTALHGTGGSGGGGIPLAIENVLDPKIVPGSVASAGNVPSFGLPLLMEFRCFPSDTALGQNGFQTAAAAVGQLFPTFRVHSTGGIGPGASIVRVDPDVATVPGGGFNPSSNPPGQRTRPNDPAFYFGQLDTVTRVTRV